MANRVADDDDKVTIRVSMGVGKRAEVRVRYDTRLRTVHRRACRALELDVDRTCLTVHASGVSTPVTDGTVTLPELGYWTPGPGGRTKSLWIRKYPLCEYWLKELENAEWEYHHITHGTTLAGTGARGGYYVHAAAERWRDAWQAALDNGGGTPPPDHLRPPGTERVAADTEDAAGSVDLVTSLMCGMRSV